jgi:hydrogenase maturation protease
VVGLGSIDRGDDAIGPVVAGLVREKVAAGGENDVRVVEHEDPTALVELMDRVDVLVIVDAVRSGGTGGTVTVREVGQGEPALAERTGSGPVGTHGLGLATAIELARALDRLPARVVVVGVEAVRFEHGQELSPLVAAAVTTAVGEVIAVVRGTASHL